MLLSLIETFRPEEGTVLDPFTGSHSSLLVAKTLGRSYLGIELDAKYLSITCNHLTPS